MLPLSLEAVPSMPMPTLTPASSSVRTGAMPARRAHDPLDLARTSLMQPGGRGHQAAHGRVRCLPASEPALKLSVWQTWAVQADAACTARVTMASVRCSQPMHGGRAGAGPDLLGPQGCCAYKTLGPT